MKRITISGAFAVLLMTSTAMSFALASSANSSPTAYSLDSQSSTLQKTSEKMADRQTPIGTLISVGPDWMKKLPGVKDAISREVAAHLKNDVARGNRRDAWVEAIEARGSRLYMRAKVRHYHVWDSPLGKKTMYNVTNTVETSFDPLNPDATMDKSRLCFDLARQIGGGKVCASARDIVRIVVMFL
jgi:hypothetical protein